MFHFSGNPTCSERTSDAEARVSVAPDLKTFRDCQIVNATKAPKTLGTAVSAFGQIKLAGADANGDLYWLALQAGVSLTVQVGGALGYAIVNKAVALTIPLATTANAVKAYWDGIPALLALATIDPQGTGLSNAGTVLATTLFDAGLLTFTGLDNGYSVEIIVSGNNTALSNSYTGVDSKTLTINLATDATGEATSTANAMKPKVRIRHWQKGYKRVAHCGATHGSFRTVSAKAFHDSRQAMYCAECSRLAQQAVGKQLVEDWWADRMKSVTPLDPRPITR